MVKVHPNDDAKCDCGDIGLSNKLICSDHSGISLVKKNLIIISKLKISEEEILK